MFKAKYRQNYLAFHHCRLRKSCASSNVHLSNEYDLILTNYNEYRGLKNNLLNGTLEIDAGYSTQLQLVDVQNNYIAGFRNDGNYNNVLL